MYSSGKLDKESKPGVTELLDICDRNLFPNISTRLRLAGTLPVTTCECECSFSALRRLSSYLRASRSSDRLDALALINIHCETDVDPAKVIDIFARRYPRKMELSSVLFDRQ